jgi:hypothetical protein
MSPSEKGAAAVSAGCCLSIMSAADSSLAAPAPAKHLFTPQRPAVLDIYTTVLTSLGNNLLSQHNKSLSDNSLNSIEASEEELQLKLRNDYINRAKSLSINKNNPILKTHIKLNNGLLVAKVNAEEAKKSSILCLGSAKAPYENTLLIDQAKAQQLDSTDSENELNGEEEDEEGNNFSSTQDSIIFQHRNNNSLTPRARKLFGLKSIKKIRKLFKSSDISSDEKEFLDLTTQQQWAKIERNKANYCLSEYTQAGALDSSHYWPAQGFSHNIYHLNSKWHNGNKHAETSNNEEFQPTKSILAETIKEKAAAASFIFLAAENNNQANQYNPIPIPQPPILSDNEIDQLLHNKIKDSVRKGSVRERRQLIQSAATPRILPDSSQFANDLSTRQFKLGYNLSNISDATYAELGMKLLANKTAPSNRVSTVPTGRLATCPRNARLYNFHEKPAVGTYDTSKYDDYMRHNKAPLIVKRANEAQSSRLFNPDTLAHIPSLEIPRDFDKYAAHGKLGVSISKIGREVSNKNEFSERETRRSAATPAVPSSIDPGRGVKFPRAGMNSRVETTFAPSTAAAVDYSPLLSHGPSRYSFRMQLAMNRANGPAYSFANESRQMERLDLRQSYRANETRRARLSARLAKQAEQFNEFKASLRAANEGKELSCGEVAAAWRDHEEYLLTVEGRLGQRNKLAEAEQVKAQQAKLMRAASLITEQHRVQFNLSSNRERRIKTQAEQHELLFLQQDFQKSWLLIVAGITRLNYLTTAALYPHLLNPLDRLSHITIQAKNRWKRFTRQKREERAARIIQTIYSTHRRKLGVKRNKAAGAIIASFLLVVSGKQRVFVMISVYRSKVIRLQRWWRRTARLCSARKEFMVNMWNRTLQVRLDELLAYSNIYLKRMHKRTNETGARGRGKIAEARAIQEKATVCASLSYDISPHSQLSALNNGLSISKAIKKQSLQELYKQVNKEFRKALYCYRVAASSNNQRRSLRWIHLLDYDLLHNCIMRSLCEQRGIIFDKNSKVIQERGAFVEWLKLQPLHLSSSLTGLAGQ